MDQPCRVEAKKHKESGADSRRKPLPNNEAQPDSRLRFLSFG